MMALHGIAPAGARPAPYSNRAGILSVMGWSKGFGSSPIPTKVGIQISCLVVPTKPVLGLAMAQLISLAGSARHPGVLKKHK